jgi:hypothetical protein
MLSPTPTPSIGGAAAAAAAGAGVHGGDAQQQQSSNIVFFVGAPGAGTTSACLRLIHEFPLFCHIDTRALFEAEIGANVPLESVVVNSASAFVTPFLLARVCFICF